MPHVTVKLSWLNREGFRTDFGGSDFEGSFEWAPRSLTPRLVTEATAMRSVAVAAARVELWRGRVYTISDNDGNGFRFAPCHDGGYVALEAVERADALQLHIPGHRRNEARELSSAAIAVTDAMLIGIEQEGIAPGMSLDATRSVARRASWYSLGFSLRDAAARFLQIRDARASCWSPRGSQPRGDCRSSRVPGRRPRERSGSTALATSVGRRSSRNS